MTAHDLLSLSADLSEEEADAEFAAWMRLREPARAAEELLGAAVEDEVDALVRVQAASLVGQLGEVAIPAWRSALNEESLRSYAATHLTQLEVEDAPEPTQADTHWLILDMWTISAGLGRAEFVSSLEDIGPATDLISLLDVIWKVRHPHLDELLEAIAEAHPDRTVGKAAKRALFKARSGRLTRCLTEREDGAGRRAVGVELAVVHAHERPFGGGGGPADVQGLGLAAQRPGVREGGPDHVHVELHRGVGAARREGRHHRAAEGRVEQRGEVAAVDGAHRVVLVLARLPLEDGQALLDPEHGEPEGARDRGRRDPPVQHGLEELQPATARRCRRGSSAAPRSALRLCIVVVMSLILEPRSGRGQIGACADRATSPAAAGRSRRPRSPARP